MNWREEKTLNDSQQPVLLYLRLTDIGQRMAMGFEYQ
jgi:hypothetical protein